MTGILLLERTVLVLEMKVSSVGCHVNRGLLERTTSGSRHMKGSNATVSDVWRVHPWWCSLEIAGRNPASVALDVPNRTKLGKSSTWWLCWHVLNFSNLLELHLIEGEMALQCYRGNGRGLSTPLQLIVTNGTYYISTNFIRSLSDEDT